MLGPRLNSITLTPLIFAFVALALLSGCNNTLLGNLNMGGSNGDGSKTPTLKTEAATPAPVAAPKKDVVFVFSYSVEGLPVTSGKIISVNAPDKEFPAGSITIEIDMGEGKSEIAQFDPRGWKVVRPTSPIKLLPPAKAEIVPVK